MIVGPMLVGVFLASQWLTGRLRRYALAKRLVDIPNSRSSHSVDTPRGGGLAIVLSTLMMLPLAGAAGALTWPAMWALSGGGALVALIGFVDDHGHVGARWRLLGHFSAGVWALAWLGGLPALPVLGLTLHLGWFGHLLALFYLVWLLNLTNFMDGIDGIAGMETVFVSLGGAILYWMTAPSGLQWLTPVILAVASLGFLRWNWPPARIFMGDAGSGFVGFVLAVLSVQAAWTQPSLFWGWIIMLGVFIVDATVTLFRRVAGGARFDQAHRSHAYQHAAVRWRAHRSVTLAVAVINVFWLFPLALLVALGIVDGIVGLVVAYTPLTVVAVKLRAGDTVTA